MEMASWAERDILTVGLVYFGEKVVRSLDERDAMT